LLESNTLFKLIFSNHRAYQKETNVFDRVKKLLSKGIWQLLAALIVFALAGPEIMLGMELMAMVELLGASTFVLMYASALKLFFAKPIAKYKHFERYSVLFIPSFSQLKQMPSLAYHLIPERSLIMCFMSLLAFGMLSLVISVLFRF
jgi:small-conductance mechanosensitive channel